MLNTFKFKSSVLFGTHTLLVISLRVLQLPTHFPKLAVKEFLVSFTAPNKQLPSIKSVGRSFDHLSIVYEIYKLTTFFMKKRHTLLF